MNFRFVVVGAAVALSGCSLGTSTIGQQSYDRVGTAKYAGSQHLYVDSTLVKLADIDIVRPSQSCLSGSGVIYDCGNQAMRKFQQLLQYEVSCTFMKRSPAPQEKLVEREARCYVNGEDIAETLVTEGYAVSHGEAYEAASAFAMSNGLGVHNGRFMHPADYDEAISKGLNGNTMLINGSYKRIVESAPSKCKIALVDGYKYKLYLRPDDLYYADVSNKPDTKFACSEHEALKMGYKRQ